MPGVGFGWRVEGVSVYCFGFWFSVFGLRFSIFDFRFSVFGSRGWGVTRTRTPGVGGETTPDTITPFSACKSSVHTESHLRDESCDGGDFRGRFLFDLIVASIMINTPRYRIIHSPCGRQYRGNIVRLLRTGKIKVYLAFFSARSQL
jgi:hypothetical protein